MDVHSAVVAAEARIRDLVRETPVEPSPALGGPDGPRVHLKLENFQATGSFKLRGAVNKLRSLTERERSAGVVAASSGNHGAAVACGARELGCACTIFVPEATTSGKVAAIEAFGAEVVRHGDDCVVTEAAARRHAGERGAVYVSPYNDPLVVAGQGTVGAELARQLPAIDAVYVALGGGGLIAGIAGYLKAERPGIEVVACSPERSPVMHESVAAGRILELPSQPTLSDSTAGGVEPGSITFELCRDLIDRYVLVSEAEIRDAMLEVLERHHMLVEGAAGVAVSGFLRERARHAHEQHVAIVLCGANVSVGQLREVLCR